MGNKKKILIVGSGVKEYALAKHFAADAEVFAAPGNQDMAEFAQCVDIRESKPQELLAFALENKIDLTVSCSEKSIRGDIADIFHSNEQLIFAPTPQAADFTLSKSDGKKFMYKLHIPSPKFGVFDKPALAAEYLKNSKFPVVISGEEAGVQVCTTITMAKNFVEDLFLRDEKKIIVEDFVYGHNFTFYVITDGCHALPLMSCADYGFLEEDSLLPAAAGAFAPDYKVSDELEYRIMRGVVFPALAEQERCGKPYSGILGVNCVLRKDGSFNVLRFKPFLQDIDAQTVLNLVDENLYALFEACAVGSFADDYEYVRLNGNASVSCVLYADYTGAPVAGLDLAENYIPINISTVQPCSHSTQKGACILVTGTAPTLARARQKMHEDIDLIQFDGKEYRQDV